MLHILNNKSKLMIALAAIFAGGLFIGGEAKALSCEDDDASCVEVSFGTPQGDLSVQPGLSYYDSTKFYLPVEIGLKNASVYTVRVYGSGSNLVSGGESIPTIGTDTAYADLGKNGSEWGIRWNLGDAIEDKDTNYHKVPASSDDSSSVVIENKSLPKSSTIIKKQLTLGFAVAVDGDQPSGSYTNTITVAVVASPRDARSFFDISTMQEMTTEICENTTTPNVMAISTSNNINVTSSGASYTTAIDTTGDHPDDGNYVPQTELTDTRDGKKYTIRKLADGNCWMVSNLEFDFVPVTDKTYGQTPVQGAFSISGDEKLTGSSLVLTSENTDLNSMDEWTPAISFTTYGVIGTVYRTQRNANKGGHNNDTATATTGKPWDPNGSDGLRSFSSAAAYPTVLYSTKTAADPIFGTAATGLPWQKFGNLYNWTAATLGSGVEVAADGQDAADSVCPKGWKLPSGAGADSFSNLFNTYNLTTLNAVMANQVANFPLNFMRTGDYVYDTGSIYYRNTIGYWWSGTQSSKTNTDTLAAASTNVAPQYSYSRGYGFAIRCVAR